MGLYDIPGLNGYKTALAGWALLLVGIGKLTFTVGMLLQGNVPLAELLPALQQAAMGLAVLGLGDKFRKLKEHS